MAQSSLRLRSGSICFLGPHRRLKGDDVIKLDPQSDGCPSALECERRGHTWLLGNCLVCEKPVHTGMKNQVPVPDRGRPGSSRIYGHVCEACVQAIIETVALKA